MNMQFISAVMHIEFPEYLIDTTREINYTMISASNKIKKVGAESFLCVKNRLKF